MVRALTACLLAAACSGEPAAGGGDWLHTSGNHIYTSDGRVWHGRGANLHDTRSCGACTFGPPDPAEVERRADALLDGWGATFVRLDLESYAAPMSGQVQWRGVLDDAQYLADVQRIVAHLTAKPGVYVLLSLWVDPTFDAMGWPTEATRGEWRKLAAVFAGEPKVLYGLVNEPQNNFDGMQDAACWAAMKATVDAIRGVEDAAGTPHHVIAVQGTGGWSRRLDYYMTEADCMSLMQMARAAEVPHLAWTFHQRCPPNLIVDQGGGCGAGMSIAPTSWGTLLMGPQGLGAPW